MDSFGEHSNENKLKGKGIKVWSDGSISIGCWNNEEDASGDYIEIHSWGGFDVAESYLDQQGERKFRGTQFNTDGTTEKYDDK